MPAPDLIELFVQPLNQYQIRTLSVQLAPPEYVIIRKLEYYREGRSEKHLRDIRGMLSASGGQIDRSALADWISRRHLDTEWQQALA